MTHLANTGRGTGSGATKAAPTAMGMTAKGVALALVALWSAPLLHAATASVEGNVVRVLATGDGRFGGCMAALDVAPADAGLDCPGQWVTLDCVGEYADQEGVGRMIESLRAAVVTGKSVEMRVTDEKKHGGYCYASRIKIQDEPHEDGDSDADGVLDLDDDVPLDASETVDTDDDGTGDGADADDDNDGVEDADDAFPLDPDEHADTDSDGIGDNADTDDDNDGIPDVEDSCPLDPDNGCPLPDLIVDSASANPVTVGEGESFTFSATVRNRGTGRSEATMLRYFRSMDAAISRGDTEVGADAVPELAASDSLDRSIELVAPEDAGTYHYGGCVDSVSDESDTGNNCSGSVEVEVSGGDPDLVVESPSTSESRLEPGESFTLRATVRNRGDGQSAATTLRYYRSTNSTISSSDTEVGTDSVGSLPASATSGESITLRAPSDSGTYYYGACVDSVSDESDTANNCSSGVEVEVSGGGGEAVTGSITECSGTTDGSFVNATIRGNVQANRAVESVRVEGTANGNFLGIRTLGDMARGESSNFAITGTFFEPGATRIRCEVTVRWLERSGEGVHETSRTSVDRVTRMLDRR